MNTRGFLNMVQLYLSQYANKQKPNANQTAIISKHIINNLVSIDLETFAYEVSTLGKTCVLGVLYPKSPLRKHVAIVQQELIMLDFDNKHENTYSYDDCLKDPFMKENALFVYKTFGDNSTQQDRFRVVFCLSEPIANTFKVEFLYNSLFESYPQADISCNYPTRLFYGSNRGFYTFNFKNTLDIQPYMDKFDKKSVLKQRMVVNSIEKKKEDDLKLSENIPTTTDIQSLTNWELLKIGEYDEFKERIGDMYSQVFASKSQAQLHFKSAIDLRDFLGIDETKTFCDIFHYETNPSADIFLSDSETFLYKCFSENHKFCGDIVMVISRLTGLGAYKSLELLIDLTSSKIDIDSNIARITTETELFISILESPDIKDIYPDIYKILGRHIPEVVKILQIITDFKYEDIRTGEVRLISFLSVSSLTKRVCHSLHKNISEKRMKRIINLMTLSNIVLKLNDGQIPQSILYTMSQGNPLKSRPNVLEIAGFSDTFMSDLQEKCEQLLDNDFTLVALSFDFLNRNFGSEEAYKVYPQVNLVKQNQIEQTNIENESIILSVLMPSIQEKSYVFEKELRDNLNKALGNKELSDYKWKQLRNDILNKYGLKRTRLTKQLKEEFNIIMDSQIYPILIYTDN